MKKVLLAAIAIYGFAQEGAKKPAKKSGQCERGKTTHQEVKAADKKPKDTKVVLKKDGTPNKIYE